MYSRNSRSLSIVTDFERLLKKVRKGIEWHKYQLKRAKKSSEVGKRHQESHLLGDRPRLILARLGAGDGKSEPACRPRCIVQEVSETIGDQGSESGVNKGIALKL